MSLLPHTAASFCKSILTDLRVGQSTADSIAGRIGIPTMLTEKLCELMRQEGMVETLLVNNILVVYRATPKGLEYIS
jgi:hypothetical protein